jgi:hypothetical protein
MDDLYPHQRAAVDKLSNGKILWGGVGSGKSRAAVAYYREKEAPKDVYVITTAKKRDSLDWEKEFVRYGIYKSRDATLAGVLTVDSWNNITKYKSVRNAFFIFDEQRLVGSGAWAQAFVFITKAQNKNTWIMLSATPGDNWLDYIPVFIANGFYKNRTEFKDNHVVYAPYTKFPKVERYIGVGRLNKYRNHILVHMPYERHTTRKTYEIEVGYDKELLDRVLKDRWNVYTDEPIKSLSEFFYTMRRVVYSHPSRLEAVRKALKTHPKLIVFYNFDYELELLRTLAKDEETTPVQIWHAQARGKKPNDNSVYVGRPSKWGNPFKIGRDGTRDEVLEKYRAYLLGSKELTNDLHELRGKDLVCWCAPEKCHANILSELANKKDFAVAEWNGKKHEPIPDSDSWVYLVQYVAGAEGWNCISTDATLFYSVTYSYKNWHQAHGRIDRLNTPFSVLHYYVLLAKSVIDPAVMASLKAKKSFNEVRFAGQLRASRV